MRTQILLLAVLVALISVDIATTFYGLSLGATELNPLFNRQSILLKLCLAFVYAGLFTLTYKLCIKEGFSKGLWILNANLLVLVGIYTVVVANNLIGIILNS